MESLSTVCHSVTGATILAASASVIGYSAYCTVKLSNFVLASALETPVIGDVLKATYVATNILLVIGALKTCLGQPKINSLFKEKTKDSLPSGYLLETVNASIKKAQINKAIFLGFLTFAVITHRGYITPVAMQALEGVAHYSPKIRLLAEYTNLLESVKVVEQTWENYLSLGFLS